MRTERRTIHPEVRVLDAKRGVVEYVASDETLDSYREVIRASGWRFNYFKKNAPFVDSHDYGTIEKLVGKVVDFEVRKKQLVETVQWAIDVAENQLAQIGWKMTEAGYLKAVSVGFWPVKSVARWRPNDAAAYAQQLQELGFSPENGPHTIYLEQEQVELSAVIIGANPNALAKAYKAEVIGEAEIDFIATRTEKPALPIEVRVIQEERKAWFCPHCRSEILEKHLASAGGDHRAARHIDCNGLVTYPPLSAEEQQWLDQFSQGRTKGEAARATDNPAQVARAMERAREAFWEEFNKRAKL